MYNVLLCCFLKRQQQQTTTLICKNLHQCHCSNKTDEKNSPQKAKPPWENSRLGFIEVVHQGK